MAFINADICCSLLVSFIMVKIITNNLEELLVIITLQVTITTITTIIIKEFILK